MFTPTISMARVALLFLHVTSSLASPALLWGSEGDSNAIGVSELAGTWGSNSLLVARAPREQCPSNFPTGSANPVPFFGYPSSVIVAAPKCPTSAPSCGTSGCGAKWNTNDGTASCTSTGPLEDCGCVPDANLCGQSQLCDYRNCSGSLDIATSAFTCKQWWKPCPCLGTDQLCGAKRQCGDCGGGFAAGAEQATCASKFPGCKCNPTATNCGAKPSCDDCSGVWRDNQGFCSKKKIDCPCTPGTLCGATPQSCDLNGCAGQFPSADPRVAKCTGNFAGCQCLPQTTQCGNTPQSCDNNGCAGLFPTSDPRVAKCTGNYQGCPCTPQTTQCGNTPKSCDNNGCAGQFPSGNPRVAKCTGNYQGCTCLPQTTQCGNTPQSCDNNGCAGQFPSGNPRVAVCTGNYQGCACRPETTQCGNTPQSCDSNGCAGQFPSSDPRIAICTGNYQGCACRPETTQCGNTPKSCENNDCAGKVVSGKATCTKNFQGCACAPSAQTPGFCPSGGIECNDPACNGNSAGVCSNLALRAGCPCKHPLSPPATSYCVGFYDSQACSSCTPHYAVGYRRTDNSGPVTKGPTLAANDVDSICGKVVNGAQIECYRGGNPASWPRCTGDYSVAAFNSRACRTPCDDWDGSGFCFQEQLDNGGANVLHRALVCDRPLQ